MARSKKNLQRASKKAASGALADNGINTGADFSRVMAAMLADVINGRMEPQKANAACNVAGKLIRMVELQHKYGKPNGGETRMLALVPIAPSSEAVQ